MGVLKRNPWDSPYPVRNRVHLADIVNTKKQHDDIFVKTGLLCPLKLSTSHADNLRASLALRTNSLGNLFSFSSTVMTENTFLRVGTILYTSGFVS